MNSQLPETYNLSLKWVILNSGFTQKTIARKARIENTRFTRIVRGQVPSTPKERRRVARILQCPLESVFPSGVVAS